MSGGGTVLPAGAHSLHSLLPDLGQHGDCTSMSEVFVPGKP